MEGPDSFDRSDSTSQQAQHSRLIPAARPDLQHVAQRQHRPFSAGRWALQKQADHARHHGGLGNGLPMADGQTGVLVSLNGQRGVHEQMPGHPRHRLQHHRLQRNAAAPQALDHAQADRVGVQPQARGRVASLGSRGHVTEEALRAQQLRRLGAPGLLGRGPGCGEATR